MDLRTFCKPTVQPETAAYLRLPGVSLTPAQIAALDADNRTINAGGSVVYGSITAYFSVADKFITQSSLDLRRFISRKLSFVGGANSLVTPVGGMTPGTGETYTDLITGDNSTFASDTGYWSKGTGWGIAGGVATHTGSTGGSLSKNGILTIGALYTIIADISGTNCAFLCGSGSSQQTMGVGTARTVTLPAISGTMLSFYSAVNGTALDNVLCRKLLTPDATGVISPTSFTVPTGTVPSGALQLTVSKS